MDQAVEDGSPRWSGHQTLSDATTVDGLISVVTVTDPRHALHGQHLAVLSLGCSRGPRFIAVALPDGRRRLIRRAATDLERPATTEPPVPRVSARLLLPLARHIRSLVTLTSTETTHAAASSRSNIPASISPMQDATTAAMASVVSPITAATGAAYRPPAATPPRGGTSC